MLSNNFVFLFLSFFNPGQNSNSYTYLTTSRRY